ncbi:tetratricopeptide repeat protein [Cupriavidus gilardii J11]|uniref:Tetratricopeptide repeat protein n=1 Tax=Cupriavidus gilardii J11 TaxID=936133 RepID=A0A562BA13_9BURK|nr:tetratricopeptide repeat protein [Cupriavidus gilardii J11]
MIARALAAVATVAWLGGCSLTAVSRMDAQADAQIALSKRQDQEARDRYDDRAVYQGLIEKMQQQGLYYASLAHLDAYAQRFGTAPKLQLLRADALRETGQHEEARAAYTALLDTGFAARAHQGLGLLAARDGDFTQAVASLRAALARDPVDALIANDLGYALMRAGELRQARVPVMQALQLDGANPRIASNAAVWLLATGDGEAARTLMERAALPPAARQAVAREAEHIAGRAAPVASRNGMLSAR